MCLSSLPFFLLSSQREVPNDGRMMLLIGRHKIAMHLGHCFPLFQLCHQQQPLLGQRMMLLNDGRQIAVVSPSTADC